MIETVDRENSDQFDLHSCNEEELQYLYETGQINDQDIKIYNLEREVAYSSNANELLQVGREAEELKQYLIQQKQNGAPVGDIEDELTYLMSQSPEQREQYKVILEGKPKVQLGRMEMPKMFGSEGGDDNVLHFEQNSEEYAKYGVTKEDMKYASYVRVNEGVNEKNALIA